MFCAGKAKINETLEGIFALHLETYCCMLPWILPLCVHWYRAGCWCRAAGCTKPHLSKAFKSCQAACMIWGHMHISSLGIQSWH